MKVVDGWIIDRDGFRHKYPHPENTVITQRAFLKLLGDTVVMEILALSKVNLHIELFYIKWLAGSTIDLRDEDTMKGLDALADIDAISLTHDGAERVKYGLSS